MSNKIDNKDYEIGTGNVFADLGLANPEERALKARLASLIYDILQTRSWTQTQAAEVLGITQPDVSKVSNGILRDFSVERLLGFLSKLDQKVTITVQDELEELPLQEIVIAASQIPQDEIRATK